MGCTGCTGVGCGAGCVGIRSGCFSVGDSFGGDAFGGDAFGGDDFGGDCVGASSGAECIDVGWIGFFLVFFGVCVVTKVGSSAACGAAVCGAAA